MPKAAPTFRPMRARGKAVAGDGQQRPSAASRGYDHRWRELRSRLIEGDPAKWLKCAQCGEYATDPSRIHLDHIKPLNQGGARLDERNLQPLCPECHGGKTRREVERVG